MPVYYGRHPVEELFEWVFEGGCLFLVVPLVVFLLFLSTLSRVVGRVRQENRRIEPAQVWLNLVPFFNLVWLPITVDRVAASIKNECEERGLDEPSDSYSRTTGLTWLSLLVFALPALAISRGLRTPCLALVFVVFAVVFWVAYWTQLAGYARQLKATRYVPPADEGW